MPVHRLFTPALMAGLLTAAGHGGASGQAGAGPVGYAPELGQRHGLVLFETLKPVGCSARGTPDPLGGARLDQRLGAVLSPCTRARIASAATFALERDRKVRWRLDAERLRGVASPGVPAAGRAGRCREVRLETYSLQGDMDERTLTLCRTGASWRVEPGPRRGRFSRSG